MNPYVIQVIVLLLCYLLLYSIVDEIFYSNKEKNKIRKAAGWIFCVGEIVGFFLDSVLGK